MNRSSRTLIIVAVAALSGCAGSASHGDASEGTLWNPLNWSWSSLNPLSWFGSDLTVSDAGVGQLSGATAMNQEAIDRALDGRYTLRQGMRSDRGQVVRFWQGLQDKQVYLLVDGDSRVQRVTVSDPAAVTTRGVKIGTPFSELYGKAFGHCEQGQGDLRDGVVCQAPDSQHIRYQFTGNWHGPEGLIPPDDALKSWTVSRIIWQR
ncbi:RpoE-regulated lipoprotein [Pantoea sp. 1.19]|uniref:RpoE-regulated lipoprotein n=1 Tax=Pantoea sp. 1.19 TaxID=1925589 RepID=UPI0009489674|nr:RpoE-regulated lipoprotein [Pantoea sp. 1.19]